MDKIRIDCLQATEERLAPEHNHPPPMRCSRAHKLRSDLLLSCSVIALGAALVFPNAAYALCVPAPAGPVALTTGTCTDDSVNRTSSTVNTAAIDVTGGLYTGNNVTISTTANFANIERIARQRHQIL